MKKSYLYIIKSFAGPMVLAFLIVLFILIMQGLWRYIDELVGKGLETSVIFEFMFWLTITLIPMALPLSILFASIMTMGNLGGNNELLALKASGFSLTKILRPMFVIVVIICGFAYYVANNLMPYSNLQIQSLFWDIKHKRPDAQILPGVFSSLDDYVIKVDKKDPKTNKLSGILWYTHSTDRNGLPKGDIALTVADSGYIHSDENYIYVTLYNGVSYEDDTYTNFTGTKNTFGFRKTRFDKQDLIVDISNEKFKRTDMDLFKGQSYTFLSSSQLNDVVDSLKHIDSIRVANSWIDYSNSKIMDHTLEIDTMIWQRKMNDSKIKKVSPKFVAILNIDSLFNAMPTDYKREAVTYALNKIDVAMQRVTQVSTEISMTQQDIRKARSEWHNKWTMSIACIIFFLVGAPLGAIIRKGGLGAPTVASLLLFILYYIITTITRKLAIQGTYPVAVAMWIPNILFLPLGLFLLYKSTTDSALFDADKYKRFFKSLFRLEDKQNYHVPTKIVHNVAISQDLLQLINNFSNHTQDMQQQVQSKSLNIDVLKFFYEKYDELLCQLWGLQNEGLNECLKNYPEIDLKIQSTKIPILKQLSHRLLMKKMSQISENNVTIQHILQKMLLKSTENEQA